MPPLQFRLTLFMHEIEKKAKGRVRVRVGVARLSVVRWYLSCMFAKGPMAFPTLILEPAARRADHSNAENHKMKSQNACSL